MNPQQRYSNDVGKVALFVPNEALNMSVQQLEDVARQSRAIGIDTLVVKFADGTGKWYTSHQEVIDKYHACTSQGVGMLPFTYCYGYGNGTRDNNQVDKECAILLDLTQAIKEARGNNQEGFVMADLESEWNGQVGAAQRFVSNMNNQPGLLSITTWSDPNQQSWQSVARTLVPVVNAWIPQAYNDWLYSQLWQEKSLGELNIQPAFDLSQEFGPNHPLNDVLKARQNGLTTVYLWTLSLLTSQAATVSEIVRVMHN